ncbi:thioesterase family protein [Roseomonas sp. NAR14]|uniref:Thioesterase family protein n=1 Tax=Roseomonas acroporae TaxID=2937791 RepID=A0A9X1YBI5_9PROT|nr:thioesterase family protein [Roseomonas acroporae]MCK8786697.1 thioesterase family protein [Roseomonas acroporae]
MSKRNGSRDEYRFFLAMPTRWSDNDRYGHADSAACHAYFDTAVARCLIDSGAPCPADSPVIGVVVETHCRYFGPIGFPDTLAAGVRVGHLGNTSVRYEIGLFREGESVASAEGHLVHVYVDRETRRQPMPLPPALRAALAPLLAD